MKEGIGTCTKHNREFSLLDGCPECLGEQSDHPRQKKGGIMEDRKLRRRINIKETAKHEKYWECTVDAEGFTEEEMLEFSDSLVAKLNQRYPAPVEK